MKRSLRKNIKTRKHNKKRSRKTRKHRKMRKGGTGEKRKVKSVMLTSDNNPHKLGYFVSPPDNAIGVDSGNDMEFATIRGNERPPIITPETNPFRGLGRGGRKKYTKRRK